MVKAARKRQANTVEAFKEALADNLYYTRGQAVYQASTNDRYMTLCYTVRDQLIRRWQQTVKAYHEANPKMVYYLSAEFLLGRQLTQNMLYTDTAQIAEQALQEFGYSLADLVEQDVEPGLGNGGLGRLAACFLDSLATLGIPAVGYGIRYEYGIFKQSFVDGWQVERPDEWLLLGNPWEFAQSDDMVTVSFGGQTEKYTDSEGRTLVRWVADETVRGEPYHMLVPGYGVTNVNLIRLWRARASQEFDLGLFDEGDYAQAVAQKTNSENISKVLYPNDTTPQGRELRLRQQYFFVSCSLLDILQVFRSRNNDWDALPEKVAIQLNDTHPVVAIPELMRLLVDVHGLEWERAWRLTRGTFASTQHTLLPEAMEQWPVPLFARLLPRHLEIIYEINHQFLQEVAQRFPHDGERLGRMSIIGEGRQKTVRMAHLAVVGSHSVNGVAALQSQLLRDHVLSDFDEMWPTKFSNKTNGVTPRRFLRLANPRLCSLIDSHLGQGWLNDLDRLEGLVPLADNAKFRRAWAKVKADNKQELQAIIAAQIGLEVDPNSVFDIMVKRLHEYKRQLLKAMHIITLYHRVLDGHDIPPITFIFGAKAAPGYRAAKLIIKLINSVGQVVNNDPRVRGLLKVAFLPNFNVTLGERVYPAADISEQISLAGKEASGTGNMKFALNGALTVGTLDGANVEIRELVGADNFFLFGLDADEVMQVKAEGYEPGRYYNEDAELRGVIDSMANGTFSDGDSQLFEPLVDSLLNSDEYLLMADYRSYVDCQDRALATYQDQELWVRMSILNCARCGFFSSDRTIREYCEEIWNAKSLAR